VSAKGALEQSIVILYNLLFSYLTHCSLEVPFLDEGQKLNLARMTAVSGFVTSTKGCKQSGIFLSHIYV